MKVDDLDWGNSGKLSWSKNISEDMLRNASLWIDDRHPLLTDFEALSVKPGAAPPLEGIFDIVKGHLLNRR